MKEVRTSYWDQERVEYRHAIHANLYWNNRKVSWDLVAAMAQCVPYLKGRTLARIEKLCEWVRPISEYGR